MLRKIKREVRYHADASLPTLTPKEMEQLAHDVVALLDNGPGMIIAEIEGEWIYGQMGQASEGKTVLCIGRFKDRAEAEALAFESHPGEMAQFRQGKRKRAMHKLH
jgi:hypothetical protein